MPCSSCGQALPRFDCRSAYPTISEAVEVDARAVRERERAEQRDVVQRSNRPRRTDVCTLFGARFAVCRGGVFRTYELRVEPSASAADPASV